MPRRVIACVAFGFVATIAVAIGGALWSQRFPAVGRGTYLKYEIHHAPDPSWLSRAFRCWTRSDRWPGPVPENWPELRHEAQMVQDPFLPTVGRDSTALSSSQDFAVVKYRGIYTYRIQAFGWPASALKFDDLQFFSRAVASRPLAHINSVRFGWQVQVGASAPVASSVPVLYTIPLNPHVAGFVLDWVFYAMAWLTLARIRQARRAARVRRGECLVCRYALGAAQVCPECGTARTARREAPCSVA